MTLTAKWIDHGREPRCAPNPRYPKGKDMDVSGGRTPSCKAKLPYPAKRCGVFIVTCNLCDVSIGVTTAGRPDDPRSLKVNCRKPKVLQ